MMDALQEARHAGEKAKDLDTETSWAGLAQAYAAIAQADAMQLIVKRLEQWMDAQGVGMEMIEAAERGIRYQKENDVLRERVAWLEKTFQDDTGGSWEAYQEFKRNFAISQGWE